MQILKQTSCTVDIGHPGTGFSISWKISSKDVVISKTSCSNSTTFVNPDEKYLWSWQQSHLWHLQSTKLQLSLGPILNHHTKLNCIISPLALFGKQPFLQQKKNKRDTVRETFVIFSATSKHCASSFYFKFVHLLPLKESYYTSVFFHSLDCYLSLAQRLRPTKKKN